MKTFAPIGVVMAALVLSACIPDILNTKPEVRGLEGAAPVQTLYQPDRNTSATLRPGGELVVRLQSNPTTGYYWYQVSGDEAIVAQVSEAYIADPAPEGLTGSGGSQEFRFSGVRKGRTTLVLAYQRGPDDVVEQREIAVKVIE